VTRRRTLSALAELRLNSLSASLMPVLRRVELPAPAPLLVVVLVPLM